MFRWQIFLFGVHAFVAAFYRPHQCGRIRWYFLWAYQDWLAMLNTQWRLHLRRMQPAWLLSIFRPVISSQFRIAAPEIIAVPCWSSWNTGIFMRSRSVRSTSKHSEIWCLPDWFRQKRVQEAMISINFFWIGFINFNVYRVNVCKFPKRTDLPSMTGLDQCANRAQSQNCRSVCDNGDYVATRGIIECG